MHKLLLSIEFVRSSVDHALYILRKFNIYILLWVDDVFLFAPKDRAPKVDKIWNFLRLKLGLDEKMPIEDCLGVDIKRYRPNRRMFITQEKAIKKLQRKLDLAEIKGAPATPMDPKTKLSRDDCPSEEEARTMKEEQTYYRSVVASLIYFSMWCRPDLAYSVSQLAKFMHNP